MCAHDWNVFLFNFPWMCPLKLKVGEIFHAMRQLQVEAETTEQ